MTEKEKREWSRLGMRVVFSFFCLLSSVSCLLPPRPQGMPVIPPSVIIVNTTV